MKANPAKVIHQVTEAHRPVLLTSRGKGVAVVQSIGDYEAQTEEVAFMRAVVEGLRDVEKGKTLSVAEAANRLLRLAPPNHIPHPEGSGRASKAKFGVK